MGNHNLTKAKKAKNDEFYTQMVDIEKELIHYKDYFAGKTVYCNADDYDYSNFYKYFHREFHNLSLKKLISFNGDFRSEESIEYLKQADIVVTNPPFSLFREYVAQLAEYDKKFLILGNQNAITYKEIFKLIVKSKLWLGHRNGDMAFQVPEHYEARATRYWEDERGQKWRSFGSICWFTNLPVYKDSGLVFDKKYAPEEYPHYDNYDAINVDRVKDIPCDYAGVIGVPITFLHKFNPDQFEIIGGHNYSKDYDGKTWNAKINGKYIYNRLLIRNKSLQK